MPLVETKQGKLKGVSIENNEGKYIAFKGIPYAKPPIGELRFKAPQPPEPWEGIRDASEHGHVCPQYNERMDRMEEGSEDCLYLNVYTPTLTPAKPLPVMVWIHGGGFYTGSGNSDFYGPEFFMSNNVVLVTINYRLEVFGFLCLDIEEVPGNAGMKDQVAALRWVKENIANFGGDDDNITIFGCSAGGASTSLHLVSKLSNGLFNKAICQSGICLSEWSLNNYPRERAFQVGKLLGKETNDPHELYNFLREVPASDLVHLKMPSLETNNNDLTDSITFGPVIEKCGTDTGKFLEETPINLVKTGQMADVPLILGYTSGDGIEVARYLDVLQNFFAITGTLIPREIKLKMSLEEIEGVDMKIRKHYFGDDKISLETVDQVVDLQTDAQFAYYIRRYARYHDSQCTQPVFLYKFAAETERNFHKKLYKSEHLKGVCHTDDLMYLFNVKCLEVPLTQESRPVIDQIVRLWTNFAATGSPTSSEDKQKWLPFTDAQQNYFIIGNSLKCVKNEGEKNMQFWDAIYGEVQMPNGQTWNKDSDRIITKM